MSRLAVAAGATSSAKTSRLPVIWLVAATERRAAAGRRRQQPGRRPRARATSASTLTNSSGRAMTASTSRQTRPETSRVSTWSSVTPMIEPNSRSFSSLAKPWGRLMNRNPQASAKPCSVPIAADSWPPAATAVGSTAAGQRCDHQRAGTQNPK